MLVGSAFGRPDEDLTVRVAFVDFDSARALEAAEQLPQRQRLGKGFLEAYCCGVMKAVRRICDWICEVLMPITTTAPRGLEQNADGDPTARKGREALGREQQRCYVPQHI